MAKPRQKLIKFTIDGREVSAPEGMMIADAAKLGGIEIPVFCYEPKLGEPVGACRMCLVEIEGLPKLQTGCSTPVREGMVVNTVSEEVKDAQAGVVEFLLVNHPLDCPVCDKGGECPLQDISYGWGAGEKRSREPKRHFRKPLELSPRIAIDRERCILCYRCARFSQEVAEDHQLVLNERGSHAYIATFDGRPYLGACSGNIVELCPVGALTSIPYRFRARPWDVESGAGICTLCPAQCNVSLTVRDDRVVRVLARQNDAVDDGWLCDKGRFGYQSIHVAERITEPLVRDGGELRPAGWERALDTAATALGNSRGRACALAGGEASSEEGHLLARLLREGLASEHLDTLQGADPRALHALADPSLQAQLVDIDHADAVLAIGCEPIDDGPIFDLRLRKGVRRGGLALLIAGAQRSALEAIAADRLSCSPQGEAALALALAEAIEQTVAGKQADSKSLQTACRQAGIEIAQLRRFAARLHGAGADVVVLYGQRLLCAGGAPAAALLRIAEALDLRREGDRTCGLLGLPGGIANARGLMEAGVAPGYDAGYQPRGSGAQALGAQGMLAALADGELGLLYLLQADLARSPLAGAALDAALAKRPKLIAHADFLTDELRAHADVIFPAESYAEKEGTVVHPDGRLQRLRPAIGRQGQTRAGWWVLAELAERLGVQTGLLGERSGDQAGAGAAALAAAGIFTGGHSAAAASSALYAAAPIYADLTSEEIGGKGVRWQERAAAGNFTAAEGAALDQALPELSQEAAEEAARSAASYRSLWDCAAVDHSPALRAHALKPPAGPETSDDRQEALRT